MSFSKKTDSHEKQKITQILNIKNMALQDKYLGVPLLLQQDKSQSFSGMLSKFDGRLSMWKSKHFNQPGRTVLGSIATHQMTVFPMPKKVTDKIDSIQRNFFWNKDNNGREWFPKSWDVVASPKHLGGLNIRKTAEFNRALLTKLAWRLMNEHDALWVKIMAHKYFPDFNTLSDSMSTSGSWIWRGICEGLEIVKKHSCWEVADGKNINIWKDVWVPSLAKHVPSDMSSSLVYKVSQLIDIDTRNWDINMLKALFTNDIIDQIMRIKIRMQGRDKIRWLGTRNGSFTVKSAYNLLLNESQYIHDIQNSGVPLFPWKKLWKVQLPPKILHFIWRILHNCVATRDKLHKVVDNIDPLCPLCKCNDETCQHFLLDCPISKRLWFALDHILIG